MARKFVSPGVFTQEIDQSYLAQGVAAIGACVIGRTLKGPAFAPTVVTDFPDFVAKFGDVDPDLSVPYAVKNYLKNSGGVTVVRVLGTYDNNSTLSNGSQLRTLMVTGTLSSSAGLVTNSVLAVVHVPWTVTASLSGVGVGSKFSYNFTGSNFPLYEGTASFDPTSADYIGKAFNADPTKVATYSHYLYKNFQWAHAGNLVPSGSTDFGILIAAGGNFVSGAAATSASFDRNYSSPYTPMVKSQNFSLAGAEKVYNLFRFEALSAGSAANTDVKVSIVNIMPSLNTAVTLYGQFDVLVRQWSDTDQRMVQVETFTGCNLDKNSSNYIARRIGDQKKIWDSANRKNTVTGTYKNASKFIRVEMVTAEDPDETSLPWGHGGYSENTVSGGAIVDIPFVSNNLDSNGNVESGNIWGMDFTKDGVSDRLKALAFPGTTAVGSDFKLSHVSGTTSNGTTYCVYNTAFSGTAPSNGTGAAVTAARNGFTLAFAGGFDGWNMTDSDPYTAPTAVTAQKAAIDVVSNPDEIDMNVLVLPGVTTTSVVDYGRTICNQRADCMMIMDIPGSSVSDAIGQLNGRGIDDNYAACYYPDLVYSDTTNNVLVQVKPSVAVLGAYAFSDRVKAPYFAPAGLNRGGLAAFGIVDTKDRLTFQDRNDLYEARINPIATFPNEGIVVFGQKTLQARPSALDRVNVRRLLIYAKKTIASAARYLLFEPNNPSTWQRFVSSVNPILEEIRLAQGLERFRVVMDSTVNTPDLIDRNIMTGKIFLQPTKAAEYIDLSFIITASGVSFGE